MGVKYPAQKLASMTPIGIKAVSNPLITPRYRAGTNSCTNAKSIAYNPPTPKPTKSRMTVRYIQFPSGVNYIKPLDIENTRTVVIKIGRLPTFSAR